MYVQAVRFSHRQSAQVNCIMLVQRYDNAESRASRQAQQKFTALDAEDEGTRENERSDSVAKLEWFTARE